MDKRENVSRGIRKRPEQRKKKADMGSRLAMTRAVLERRERERKHGRKNSGDGEVVRDRDQSIGRERQEQLGYRKDSSGGGKAERAGMDRNM